MTSSIRIATTGTISAAPMLCVVPRERGSTPHGATGAGAQLVHVVVRRACLLGGVGHQAEIAGGGKPALITVEDVEPAQVVTAQRVHANTDLAVEPTVRALPSVELGFVLRRDVVDHDEDLVVRVLDDGGERTLPAEILAAEGQPPADQPAGPARRRVRATR